MVRVQEASVDDELDGKSMVIGGTQGLLSNGFDMVEDEFCWENDVRIG